MTGNIRRKSYKKVPSRRCLRTMSYKVNKEMIYPIKRSEMHPENASVVRTKIQSVHPDAVEIENNVWKITNEMTSQARRHRQRRRAFLMLRLSTDRDDHREYHVTPENFMPIGFGGTYVCSKNSSHRFYILGPCTNKRCRVRGCNGKLKMI